MIGHYSDSMQDCQAFLNKMRGGEKGEGAEGSRDPKGFEVMEETLAANAKCVAGDAPGLKGNEEVREFQLMKLKKSENEKRAISTEDPHPKDKR
jgi:hypothetical protein